MRVMEERRQKISDGLAAAEQGHHELELAQIKAKEQMSEVKTQAAYIIEQANQRANHIVEDAKHQARDEGDRLLQLAQSEIEQEYQGAKETLLQEVSGFAVAGARKILSREIDDHGHDDLVKQLVDDI